MTVNTEIPAEVLAAQTKLEQQRRKLGIKNPTTAPDFALDLYHQAGIEALIKAEQEQIDAAETRRLFGGIGYAPKWSVQTSLPHSDPGILSVWTRYNGDSDVSVQPFMQVSREPIPRKLRNPKAAPFHYMQQEGRDKRPVHIVNHGIPYGPLPRLVLVYAGWYAVVHETPEIVLGDDLSSFMTELGVVPKWGNWGTCDRLRDQVHRLATCQIAYTEKGKHYDFFKLVTTLDEYWNVNSPGQRGLWTNKITLTYEAFMSFLRHRIPLNMATLAALKKSPLALDIYSWLSWRLFSVKEGQHVDIRYDQLANQFGSGYAVMRQFKAAFNRELAKVLKEYRAARVEILPNHAGIRLLHSPTHVALKS